MKPGPRDVGNKCPRCPWSIPCCVVSYAVFRHVCPRQCAFWAVRAMLACPGDHRANAQAWHQHIVRQDSSKLWSTSWHANIHGTGSGCYREPRPWQPWLHERVILMHQSRPDWGQQSSEKPIASLLNLSDQRSWPGKEIQARQRSNIKFEYAFAKKKSKLGTNLTLETGACQLSDMSCQYGVFGIDWATLPGCPPLLFKHFAATETVQNLVYFERSSRQTLIKASS